MRGPALAIFVIALAVRLVHLWQMRGTPYLSALMGDSRGYDAWAQQLAAGDWLGSGVFYQAPLYPYFLGVVYTLIGRDLFAVRMIQAVLGALSAVALGDATARLASRPAGIVAGMMLALYAPAIFFDGLIQKSTLDVLFVCLSLSLIARIIGDGRGGIWWLLLGAAMGGLVLSRENALLLVACVLAWALVHSDQAKPVGRKRALQTKPASRGKARAVVIRRGRRWMPAFMLTMGLVIVLLPVAIRNYAVGGGFYLTTSQFGSNFYIGNNPRADGSYMSLRAGRGSPEFERVDATQLAEQAVQRRLSPGEVSDYWTDRALAYIRSEPAAWLALMARKGRLLINAAETIDTESLESHSEYSLAVKLTRPLSFGVLLPIAVIGAVVLWPERQRLGIIYAMATAYAASVVIFFVVARYRYPLVPFVVFFAAAGVTNLAAFIRSRPRARVTAATAAAAMMTVAAFWPLHTREGRLAITENNLGTALQEDGRPAEAIEHYQRALAFDDDYTPALNNLGTALRAAGRVDEAILVYQQTLARRGDDAGVHYNLANALMGQGRTSEAVTHFRQAIKANPRHLEAHHNLGLALEKSGRIDEAIAAFQGALALAPHDAVARYDLGTFLLERKLFAQAVEFLREAVKLEPRYAEAHNNLGIALASQGQIGEAITHWREAIRIKPDFADARRNLELALKGLRSTASSPR